MQNTGKVILVSLLIVLALSLTGCGQISNIISGTKDSQDSYTNSSDTGSNQGETSDNQGETSDNQGETPDNQGETLSGDAALLADDVNATIDAIQSEGNVADFCVGLLDDGTIDTRQPYYDSQKIIAAMKLSSEFEFLFSGNQLTFTDAVIRDNGSAMVQLNDTDDNMYILSYGNDNGTWKVDISSLETVLKIEVPRDIEIKLNGVVIDPSYVTTKDELYTYEVPRVLLNTTATVEYETGFSSNYSGSLEVTKKLKSAQRMLYEIGIDELDETISELANIWTTLKAECMNENAEAVSNLLSSQSKITAEMFIEALHKNNYDIKVTEFIKSSNPDDEYKSYVTGENSFRVGILGKFYMGNSILDPKTPSESCWVEVEKTADGLKIISASNEVWLEDVNFLSVDEQ